MVDFVAPEGSTLGTKKYWDQHYEQELDLLNQGGDCGEVWFGTKREDQLINWILKNISNPNEKSFLDVGCGNGHLLHSLCKKNNSHQLIGLDYSENSLKLAQKYFDLNGLSAHLFLFDLLSQNAELDVRDVDVVIDKGTFDAICLFQDSPGTRESCASTSLDGSNGARIEKIRFEIVPKYLSNIARFLRTDGVFIIATCNWTFAEVEGFFSTSGEFRVIEEIKGTEHKSSFMFGGCTGNSVTCVAFAKT